jgi:peptidoglycan-N-acetylglucosamine deacetylase
LKLIYLPKSIIYSFAAAFVILAISCVYAIGGGFRQLNVFLNTQAEIPIYSVETSDKKLALTFDISEGMDYTDEIIKVLDNHKVKATFFLVGSWIDKNPGTVKKLFDKGYQIENHSDMHQHMIKQNKNQNRSEIKNCYEKIEKITGVGSSFFRVPFGEYNSNIMKIINEEKHIAVQCDINAMNINTNGNDLTYENIIKTADKGSIILMNNSSDQISVVLDKVINKLQVQGYKMVKLSDLIYKDNYYIDHLGRQRLLK